MNNIPQYQVVENRPIGCMFCGAQVHGKVTPRKDAKTKNVVNECRWQCGRCGNLSKIGIVK
jgi:hypothetical protein